MQMAIYKLRRETSEETNPDDALISDLHSEDGVADSTVLSSMPCLLMELRRDSSASHDKPTTGRIYESDSSNHCMLSPSSSDHLADSDKLSSAEENELSQAEIAVEGNPSGASGATVGRKSRRSRSESETSTMAHKERIRLLRHKREVSASSTTCCRTVSSTSDSDLTCDLSTSSSDDDEEVSGSSKTITAEIPDGPPVVAHYGMPDTSSDPEHNNSIGGQDTGATWRTSWLLEELNAEAGHLHPGFPASDKISAGDAPLNEEINIASSDSEVEIVGVQEHARCVHPRGGMIQSPSTWKHGSGTQYLTEVVDFILDEDSRHKYLL
uniref:E3 ubiquitin-protein ligase Arkadia N-terminal domain-containing protein n=1 Tax=Nomascus leucogenys TaxID=61853 RepID=A0A2I3HS49_NOMLE